MTDRISFQDQINSNKAKSVFLMFAIIVAFIILGFEISKFLDPSYFFIIMIISIIFSLLYTVISYYNADKIAFASGRDPKHAVICVTTGALEKLNKQELEGIIAHEMAHVANYDIRFMTLTAVLVGMVSIAAEIFLRSLWFSNNDRNSRGNAILMIIGILFAIIAPIAAQLVSLAISRRREYTADATGVKFTRYPPGLANALKKIKHEHVPAGESRKYPKKPDRSRGEGQERPISVFPLFLFPAPKKRTEKGAYVVWLFFCPPPPE